MNHPSDQNADDWGVIVDNLHESIIVTDVEGYIVKWNKGAERLFGYTAEEVIGRHCEICHERDREAVDLELGPPMRRDGRLEVFSKMVRKSGETFDGHMLASVIKDRDGTITGMVGYILDVTRRKQVEDELRISEARLADAQRIGHLGNWEYDASRDTLWWSDETCRILGFEPDGFVPEISILHELVHPGDRDFVRRLTGGNLRPGSELSYEYRIIRPDGAIRTLQTNRELSFDDDGKLLSASGTVHDITERKQAEADLRKSEYLLSESQKLAHVGNWEYEVGNNTLHWSDETYRLLGVERGDSEPTLDYFIGFIHPDDRKRAEAELDRALTEAHPFSFEHRVVRPDGSERILIERGQVTCNAQRKVVRVFGTVQDVTEMRLAQRALQESHDDLEQKVEQRSRELAATVRTLVEGVITIDDQGTIETFNPAAEAIFGYGASEVVGHNVSMLMTSENSGQHDQYIDNYKRTGEAKIIGVGREVTGLHKNGTLFPMRLGIGEMEIGGQRKFVGTVHDVTESKAAQSALQESERNLRNLTELSPVGIYRSDVSGGITYANEWALKIAGIPENSAPYLGDDWQKYIHPDDLERFVSEFISAVKAQTPFTGEYRFGRPPGPVTWVISQAVPEFDPDGSLVGYVGTLTDITERVNSEQGAVQARKEAEEASRAKSDFLSSMSHELRTPMNAILGFSQLLEQNAAGPLNEGQKEFVDEVLRSGHHMLQLIGDVLDLAKIESGAIGLDMETVMPRPLIEGCLSMVSASAKQKSIIIGSKFPEDELPLIKVDVLRFRQALLNLLTNAVKFNRPKGRVTVECHSGANGMLRISVSDTGRGIPEEVRGRAFEPFDRLGAETSDIPGTGIGLTVTKQLIESMGGTVDFESTVDEGTSFWVNMPVALSESQLPI